MYLGLGLSISTRQGGASVPAFSPLDLPNLFGWWDASDSCYTAGSPSTNGQNINQLRDKSVNARHLVDFNAPTYTAAGINGKGSIQFAATKSLWSNAGILNTSNCHLFVVCKDGAVGKDVFGTDGTTIPDILLQLGTGPAAKCHYWGDSGLFSNTAASTITLASPYILEHVVDSTSVRAKSHPGGTEIAVTITGGRTTTAQAVVLGSRAAGGSADSFTGLIGEAILCAGSDLSAGNRASVVSYLTTKWLTASTAGNAMGVLGLTYS
jgi:hypothetical protein